MEAITHKCPPCNIATVCPNPGCDCQNSDGNVLTPKSKPPRPEGCEKCHVLCPESLIKCPTPLSQCSATQLKDYVPKCPPCGVSPACLPNECDCTDSAGNLLTPKKRTPRPSGCLACVYAPCVISLRICPASTIQCTPNQLENYIIKYPVNQTL